MLLKNEFEEAGWYAIRASGSHGIADVIAIRPVANCTNPSHFEVKFIQVKTSQNIAEAKVKPLAVDSPCGMINVEYRYYPVKNKAYFAKRKKKKKKF